MDGKNEANICHRIPQQLTSACSALPAVAGRPNRCAVRAPAAAGVMVLEQVWRRLKSKGYYLFSIAVCIQCLSLLSTTAHSSELDVEAGQFRSKSIDAVEGGVFFTIEKLNDDDPIYAPLTQLLFYNGDNVGVSIGIMKLDGKQGLTAFYSRGTPQMPEVQNAVASNLVLGTEYALTYFMSKPGRLVVEAAGESFVLNIGFNPTKAEHMVSGMKLVKIGYQN